MPPMLSKQTRITLTPEIIASPILFKKLNKHYGLREIRDGYCVIIVRLAVPRSFLPR